VAIVVPLLVCPSEALAQTDPNFGPISYAGCIGSGANGGPRNPGDGIFYVNSKVRIGDIADGTHQTAAISESTFGPGGASFTRTPDITDLTPYQTQVSVSGPLTDEICAAGTTLDPSRGSRWADGEMTGHYDHGLPPNANVLDCKNTAFTRKPARSYHPGGVNLMFADGHVQFMTNTIDRATWSALGSRDSGDVPGAY
jgi:prepilin-type processing-associated H-X9-DG protein